MGIHGFQKWFLSTFPQTMIPVDRTVNSDSFDHIAFDMNQILYTSLRRAKNFSHLCVILFREIDTTLRICRPRRSIYFAFDGPAPFAKLVTQRKRRIRSLTSTKEKKRKGRGAKYSSVELTPGTELMYKLEKAIEYYCWTRLQNNRRYRNIEMRISGPGVPGEGELKVIDWLNTFVARRAKRQNAERNSTQNDRNANLSQESVMVIGSDADICLQGIATNVIQSFFVYIRNSAPKKSKKKKRMDTCISMWSLIRTFEELFPGHSNGCRLDFLLICMLNGNDYLPKIRGVGFNALWRRYLFLKGASMSSNRDAGTFQNEFLLDSQGRTFNWPFFCALLQGIGTFVPHLTQESIEEDRRRTSSDNLELDSDSTQMENIVYAGEENPTGTTLDVDSGDAVRNEVDAATNGDLDTDEITDEDAEVDEKDEVLEEDEAARVSAPGDEKLYDIQSWLSGVLWCIVMYVDGYSPDYSFTYDYPYAPSARVIAEWIKVHDGDPFPVAAPITNTRPLPPLKAALAMLPREYSYLLPSALRPLFEEEALYSQISKDGTNVDLGELLRLTETIPQSKLTKEERQRLKFDKVLLIRFPNESVYKVDKNVSRPEPPGEDFKPLREEPVLVRRLIPSTTSAPCLLWPSGAIPQLLERNYKRPFRSFRPSSSGPTQNPPSKRQKEMKVDEIASEK